MESESESDGFYFESDHMPLRGNQDYSNLLRTIALLEACKLRLHAQIQELESANRTYVGNPELLLSKFRNNEEILPKYGDIKIPELPSLIGTYQFLKPAKSFIKEEPADDVKPVTVRGRVFDETKCETFNKLWTCEEQRRLEELLIEYPPEKKEMRRYAKIAKALGNRTAKQVCSRVQKYFKKLSSAGMPIPGRRPKNTRTTYGKTKYSHRPSTFFPLYNVRVNMPDDEDFDTEEWRTSMYSTNIKREYTEPSDDTTTDDRASPVDNENDNDNDNENEHQIEKEKREKIIYMLEALRDEKAQCGEGYQPDPMTPLCEKCQEFAATLKQWHCRTCHVYLRQCADCIITELVSDDFEHITHDIMAED